MEQLEQRERELLKISFTNQNSVQKRGEKSPGGKLNVKIY